MGDNPRCLYLCYLLFCWVLEVITTVITSPYHVFFCFCAKNLKNGPLLLVLCEKNWLDVPFRQYIWCTMQFTLIMNSSAGNMYMSLSSVYSTLHCKFSSIMYANALLDKCRINIANRVVWEGDEIADKSVFLSFPLSFGMNQYASFLNWETLTNSSSLNFRLLSCAVLNIFYNPLWKKAMEEGKNSPYCQMEHKEVVRDRI
jgi:hypothetical protein